MIFDSGMIRRGLPAFNVATRGLVVLPRHAPHRRARPALRHVRRRGAERRRTRSCGTLDALLARDGRLAEPLARASWRRRRRSSPAGASCRRERRSSADQGARPTDPAAAEEFYLRTFAEPALDVNGVAAGSPHLQKTVLPVEAVANLSIRLAPGQSVEEIAPRSSDCCASRRRRARSSRSSSGRRRRPGLVPPGLAGDPARARRRSSASSAVRPALVRSGGTLPIVPALAGQGHPDDHHRLRRSRTRTFHSPNERLRRRVRPARHRHRDRALQRACAAPALRSRPRRLHGAAS